MDIKHLENFRKLPRYEDLIEVKDTNGRRWLFATDKVRAIGLRTDEYIVNSTKDGASTIQEYVARTNFVKLDRQHFMAYLHSSEEEPCVCSECNGSRRVNCEYCDGEGQVDCSYCDGNGVVEEDCEECEGSGERSVDCNECDGSGQRREECSNCTGTAHVELDCPECEGSGIEDEDVEEEDRVDCKKCSGTGTVEEPCEECEDGYVEEECCECEGSGRTEEECENCSYGKVENDCEECDCGRVDCNECEDDHQQDCQACEDDPSDIGEIFGHKVNLALLKDLSMKFFDEVSSSPKKNSEGFVEEPIIFRGKDMMAIIMPGRFEGNIRKYEPKRA